MTGTRVVLIGASQHLPALKDRAGLDQDAALAFSDSQPLQALEAITEHRPGLIVLERVFAATPRGAALINRIKSDPTLAHAEIRVISHDGRYSRVIARPGLPPDSAAAAPAGEPPVAQSWRIARRAPRVPIRQGVKVQVDGHPAPLVDLSRLGAQLLSPVALRPAQKIRVVLPNESAILRLGARVAWARFALPRKSSAAPHYRVGVEFNSPDPEWIDGFCARYRV